MSLDDCGKKIRIRYLNKRNEEGDVKVIMVIKAPRGEMRLFKPNKPSIGQADKQRLAIRIFMRQHRSDLNESIC